MRLRVAHHLPPTPTAHGTLTGTLRTLHRRFAGPHVHMLRPMSAVQPASIDDLSAALGERSYLADRGLATVLHVALKLGKPLLLEGEAGVGKTEVAKTLADVLGARLIRLQCYEGIDVAHALYDWSYARQMLYIRTLEAAGDASEALKEVFGRDFLVRRPLLDAIEYDDAEFEAFLLELLSDFQITIPEIGTISAKQRPVVILTSNRTRELHDALKRRCIYHWIGHPSLEREIAIVRARVPGVPEALASEAAAFVERLRTLDLAKAPGVAETLDWTQALVALGQTELDADVVDSTLGSVLKYHEDLQRVRDHGLQQLLAEAREAAARAG
jgi:MoxR-like ATPase